MFPRAVLLAFALFALVVPQAGAEDLPGPRLAVMTHDPRYGFELITIGPTGGAPQGVIAEAVYERPSWSADGRFLAFGVSGDDGSVVAVARSDGSGLRVFPRAVLTGGDPVMSPDGESVVYQRVRLVKVLPGRESYLLKSSIWSLDVDDGSLRPLTRWRLSVFLTPSSFSPDGSTLAATSFSRRGLRAVAIDLRTGRTSLLAREAIEPTYSPDGSHFAFVRYLNWRLNGINERVPAMDELRIGRVGAVTGARLLLRKRGFFASPSWDPSGHRLAFTHSPADELGDRSPQQGNRVLAINPDGTCLTRVFTAPDLTLYGAAWQPGTGREAGPISC